MTGLGSRGNKSCSTLSKYSKAWFPVDVGDLASCVSPYESEVCPSKGRGLRGRETFMRGRRCQRGVAAATCRSLWDHLGQGVRIKSTVNRSTSRVTLNQPIVQSSSIFRSSLLFLSPFFFLNSRSRFKMNTTRFRHAFDLFSSFNQSIRFIDPILFKLGEHFFWERIKIARDWIKFEIELKGSRVTVERSSSPGGWAARSEEAAMKEERARGRPRRRCKV